MHVLAEAHAAQFAVHTADPQVPAFIQYPSLHVVHVLAEAHDLQFAVHIADPQVPAFNQ